jgi:hypothetical protein
MEWTLTESLSRQLSINGLGLFCLLGVDMVAKRVFVEHVVHNFGSMPKEVV